MEAHSRMNRPLSRAEKKQIIDSFVNARDSFGLEIGCNFRPLFRKSLGFAVQYLENTDSAGIAARCKKGGKDPSLAETIDFVFDEKKTLSELTGSTHAYKYAVSSHVIEHIPDLVRHFREIDEILEPGGVYAMMVPDKNYTFDALRPASTLGEFIEAHCRGDSKPPLSAYIDQVRYAAKALDAPAASSKNPGSRKNQARKRLARKRTEGDRLIARCLENGRVPRGWLGHRWVFTPFSFVSIFFDLVQYQLIHFDLLEIRPTYKLDFIAVICTASHSRKVLNRQTAFERLFELGYADNFPHYSVPHELLFDVGNCVA
jgi:SAM-dependent methyltransferase